MANDPIIESTAPIHPQDSVRGLYSNGGYVVGDDLYFVISAERWCKIGRTGNIKARMATLQNASPHDLDLFMLLPGMGWSERVWHMAFRHVRLRGEWFQCSPALMLAIKTARAGEEWIATLKHPYLRGIEEHYRWRDYIADIEEVITDKMHMDGALAHLNDEGEEA